MNSNEKTGAEYAQNGSTMGAMLYLLRELPNGVAAHYAIGFSSYISLRKREIRKKIKRLRLIHTAYRTKTSNLKPRDGSIIRFGWATRISKIISIYQKQLTALDKQLTS